MPPTDPAAVGEDGEATVVEGPTGPGWVIQIKGYHFFNKDRANAGAKFVKETFMQNLENKKIRLPDGPKGKLKLVAIKDLGIGYPVIVRPWPIRTIKILDPNAAVENEGGAGGLEGPGGRGNLAQDEPEIPTITLRQFDFILQFCWQETPLSRRLNPDLPKAGDPAADGGFAVTGGN